MIGTIRKHSSWLWLIIAGLTIISFVWFMGSAPSRSAARSGGSAGDFGTIYGRRVTQQDYVRARNEFSLFYWQHNGEWPGHTTSITANDIDRETYIRLLLTRKGANLGIQISDDAVAAAASEFLHSLGGRSGQSVPMDEFVLRVLQPQGLTAEDFADFIRSDMIIQQLVNALGLSGTLVTPQEAAMFYQRDHQEVSAQVVFFSASNYLAQVVATPANVGQYFTNYLAAYRLPDRVQVNYVAFELTNYLAQSRAEWAKTNLEDNVDAAFRQYGMSAFPGAKTEADAKAQIREGLIRRRALLDAKAVADDFATVLFAMDPAKAENLNLVAKQKGLTVQTTEPFAADSGPMDFVAPAEFTKSAFQLNADVPVAGPIAGTETYYVIALAKQLPSEIPPLDQIRERVTEDYKERVATIYAERAGTNFVAALPAQVAAGKSFSSAAAADGFRPEILPPFSLDTEEVPAVEGRVELNRLKQAAFTTPPGHISQFIPTADGGFVLYVQSLLPLDEARKAADMPQFIAQLRRARQNEAFNEWLGTEANRELRNTPFYQRQTADSAAKTP